jgi:hypothetical protein
LGQVAPWAPAADALLLCDLQRHTVPGQNCPDLGFELLFVAVGGAIPA